MYEFSLEGGATELCFVRHADAKPQDGDAEIDATYRDAPLSAVGHLQAAALAERLTTERIAAIVASPARRALETARYIERAAPSAFTTDERLREVHIGEFDRPLEVRDAALASAVRERLDRLAQIALRDGGWGSIPGTEPSQEVRQRMRAAVADIVGRHPGERVVVVSHAGAINAYLADLLELRHDFFFPAGNTSLSVVRFNSGRRLLVGLNDIAHLRAAMRTA